MQQIATIERHYEHMYRYVTLADVDRWLCPVARICSWCAWGRYFRRAAASRTPRNLTTIGRSSSLSLTSSTLSLNRCALAGSLAAFMRTCLVVGFARNNIAVVYLYDSSQIPCRYNGRRCMVACWSMLPYCPLNVMYDGVKQSLGMFCSLAERSLGLRLWSTWQAPR